MRLAAELGAWLWIVAGFCIIIIEIFSPRTIALGLGLGAIFTGTTAIMGGSGIVRAISLEFQFGLWVLLSLIIVAIVKIAASVKARPKTA